MVEKNKTDVDKTGILTAEGRRKAAKEVMEQPSFGKGETEC
ncbi:hypothetical protein [Faecalispora anaeroviscerum]|nr:hypothetical protein [Faecalispora anaeroviscerum]